MGTMQERPAVIALNTRVNLDEVFGYVCENVVSDTVTPYKLIVDELIHLVHELDPNHSVLFREEAIMIQSMIYGLITRDDMPYQDLKRCVRHLDRYLRREVTIYPVFVIAMDSKLSGESHKTRFYESNTRKKDRKELVEYKSPIHLFKQKLYVAGQHLTQQQRFEMHEKIKDYIRGEWPIKLSGQESLPFEINTSIAARQWLRKQMHLLQVCPSEAMEEEKLFKWCNDIKNRHKDIPDVYLLEMIAHVSYENFQNAEESLRRFFDFSVLRPNTQSISSGNRIGVPDQRPFRFGPLLTARLHRILGDKVMSRQLLQECMREAQSSQDYICYKFVYLELCMILAMSPKREEQQLNRHSKSSKKPTYVKTICMSDALTVPEPNLATALTDPEEHIHSAEMYLNAASQLAEGIERLRYTTLDEHDFSAQFTESVTLDDRDAKSRLLNEAGIAVLISYRMRQGYYKSAENMARALIESNGNDCVASHHETEAQIIAHVNRCYVKATDGLWEQSLMQIDSIAQTFSLKPHWQLSKTINLARSCLRFNNFFRRAMFSECEEELEIMEKYSFQEWFLKKCLLLAVCGRMEEAKYRLIQETEYFGRTSRVEITYLTRVHMQLALIEAHSDVNQCFDSQLYGLLGNANLNNDRLLLGMISRRIATATLNRGQPRIAANTVEDVLKENLLGGNYLELGLAYLTRAKATMDYDSGVSADALNEAEKCLVRAGYPVLRKWVYKMQAELFERYGDEDAQYKALEEFCSLDNDFPGFVDWSLI